MSNPALATPTSPYLRRVLVLSLGAGLAGVSVAVGAVRATVPATPEVELSPPVLHDEPRAASVTDTARDDAAPTAPVGPAPTYATVTVGGTTYVKLARIATPVDDPANEPEVAGMAMPKHGRLRGSALTAFSGDAVASVAARDAGAFASWKGTSLVVGTGCSATVTGFAVVSTLEGDPFAMGTWDGEGEPPKLTVKDVYEQGDRMFVATLSTSCAGAFARPSAAPRARAVETLTATASQIAAARAALVDSQVGHQLNDAWAESGAKVAWDTDPDLTFSTTRVRHQATGKEFLSIHATMPFQCGGLEANIWGLYQIEGDVLVPVAERGLEGISEIVELVDVDGDGTPDLVGKGGLGLGIEIQLADGTVSDTVDISYNGCPC